MRLYLAPCTLAQAQAFIREHHRHHDPPHGHKFSLCVHDGASIRGVATVGRPIARLLDDDRTLEITRVCTDGTRNASSKLLGAAWRAAQALGYRRIVTYTMPDESGASLRGAGFTATGETHGRSWNTPGRPRRESVTGQKIRWEKRLHEDPDRPPFPQAAALPGLFDIPDERSDTPADKNLDRVQT